jgi:septal ring-binding cell division protein DamX
MKHPSLVVLLFVLTACSNNPTATSTDQAENISRAQDKAWFCQMDENGEDWQCVQDAALARNPKPDRLPVRDQTNVAAAQISAPTEPDPVAENTEIVQPPADADAAKEAARAIAEPVTDLPTHIALSYRPDQPVALTDLPADYFAVQLIAVSRKKDLEAFAEQHQIRGMSAARILSQDQLFYVLLLGVYENFANAERAVASLGPPFDTLQPWIRPMGPLQKSMLAADEYAGSSEI